MVTAVVAVMSVQPTSEKRTVLQLSGSCAAAAPADNAIASAAMAHPFMNTGMEVSLDQITRFAATFRQPRPAAIETSKTAPGKLILIDRSIKNR